MTALNLACPNCGTDRVPYETRSPGKVRKIRFVCRPCDNARVRRSVALSGRKTDYNRTWQSKNAEKRQAHKAVEYALIRGDLVREPCCRCGCTEGVHAHHDDYSKPLEVMWLCPGHHKQRHRELKSGFGPGSFGSSGHEDLLNAQTLAVASAQFSANRQEFLP